MRGRLLLAGVGVAAGLTAAVAQFPPPAPLPPSMTPPPQTTAPPGMMRPAPLPPTPTPMPAARQQPGVGLPDGSAAQPPAAEVPLPYPERKTAIDPGTVSFRRMNNAWQVWAGPRLFRDCGANEADAREIVRTLRELRVTEWVGIGSPRPVVEYGLVGGRPPVSVGQSHLTLPVSLAAVRVEPVRGVWCVRDDDNILFNFGTARADAEQAAAVIKKYGFNRVGVIGTPGQPPAMTYLFATLEGGEQVPRPPAGGLAAAAQENGLVRTGIPVPGVGYMGEMVRIDAKKVEVRKDGGEWVLAYGPDVLGRFGAAEWPAREAARAVADAGFTEYCRVGTAGMTFFLTGGQAPTRVPYAARGRRFDLQQLRVQQLFDKWAVTEGGRHLFDVGTAQEGEAVIRLLRYYRFDQLCHLGPSPTTGLHFLAKTR